MHEATTMTNSRTNRGHEQLGGPLNASANAMDDDEMGDEQNGYKPNDGTDGVGGERLEIAFHKRGVAMQLSGNRRVDVLKAPARHHGVIASDEVTGENAQQSHKLPGVAVRHLRISAIGVGSAMTTYDKLRHHAGNAQQQHATYIYKDKGGTSVLSGHVRKTPNVAQANRPASGGKDHSQLTSKACSFF